MTAIADRRPAGRAAARLAAAAPDEPARPRAGGRRVGAAPELPGDGPLAAEPRDGAAAVARSSRSRCATATGCCWPPGSRRPTRSGRSRRRRWSPSARAVAQVLTRPRAVPGRGRRPLVEPRGRQPQRRRCSSRASRRELLEPPANVLRVSLHPDGHGAADRQPRGVARAPARPAAARGRRHRRRAGWPSCSREVEGYPRPRDAAPPRPPHGAIAVPLVLRHGEPRAVVLQHGGDVRDRGRRHGRRAVDRGVLPGGRATRPRSSTSRYPRGNRHASLLGGTVCP